MITYALARKSETEEALARFVASPAAIWFSPEPYVSRVDIDNNTWHKLQLVAVHDGKVQGYLAAGIDRSTLNVTSLAMCKFADGHELEFAQDVATVFRFLKAHFRNIQWCVVQGNPLQDIYNRIVQEFNGRPVGEFRDDVRLRDGTLRNRFFYEVPGVPNPDGSTDIEHITVHVRPSSHERDAAAVTTSQA